MIIKYLWLDFFFSFSPASMQKLWSIPIRLKLKLISAKAQKSVSVLIENSAFIGLLQFNFLCFCVSVCLCVYVFFSVCCVGSRKIKYKRKMFLKCHISPHNEEPTRKMCKTWTGKQRTDLTQIKRPRLMPFNSVCFPDLRITILYFSGQSHQ